MAEMIYQASVIDGKYYAVDKVERNAAEKDGICHLTAIVVMFGTGLYAGQWLVHDRTDKLIKKGRYNGRFRRSYNLIGGHASAGGAFVSPEKPLPADGICGTAVCRELQEEVKGVDTSRLIQCLIPIGYTSYKSRDNVEYSRVWALPLSDADADNLSCWDDFEENGIKTDIALPKHFLSETELRHLHDYHADIEVCDAITRLWEPQNRAVLRELRRIIREHL